MLTVCACVHTKSHQSCLTLCGPMDCSPSGSSVPGILQARMLEWVAMVLRAAQLFLQLSVSLYLCFRLPVILYRLSVCVHICQRRQWQPTPVLLPGKSHGWRSLQEAAVRGVTKSQTRLSDFTFTFHFPALEKEMATHSSVLAWRIPGMAEPGGLPSMGSHRVGHD